MGCRQGVVAPLRARAKYKNLREGDFIAASGDWQEVIAIDKESDSVMLLLTNERIVRAHPDEQVEVNPAIYRALRGKRGSG